MAIDLFAPVTVTDVVSFLVANLSEEDVRAIREIPECDMVRFHHSLGRQLRNHWGLWNEDSPLHRYCRGIGLWHADDMSSVILTSLWRQLNGQELRVDDQVRKFQDYWRQNG